MTSMATRGPPSADTVPVHERGGVRGDPPRARMTAADAAAAAAPPYEKRAYGRAGVAHTRAGG